MPRLQPIAPRTRAFGRNTMRSYGPTSVLKTPRTDNALPFPIHPQARIAQVSRAMYARVSSTDRYQALKELAQQARDAYGTTTDGDYKGFVRDLVKVAENPYRRSTDIDVPLPRGMLVWNSIFRLLFITFGLQPPLRAAGGMCMRSRRRADLNSHVKLDAFLNIDPRTHSEQECRRPFLKLLRFQPPLSEYEWLTLKTGTPGPSELADLRVFLFDCFDANLLPFRLRLGIDCADNNSVIILALELLGRENSNVRALILADVHVSPELADRLIGVLSAGKCLCGVR